MRGNGCWVNEQELDRGTGAEWGQDAEGPSAEWGKELSGINVQRGIRMLCGARC